MKDWKWVIGGTIISIFFFLFIVWATHTVLIEVEKGIKKIEQRGIKNIMEDNLGKYWYGTDSTESEK